MPDYDERIREVTGVLSDTEDEIQRLTKTLGTRVVKLKKAQQPDGTESLLQEHKALTAQIDAAGDAIETLTTIDARQHEIQLEMKELRNEYEQLDKGLDPVFEQIGSVAFRLFKEHPLVDASYSNAFAGLAKYYDTVRSLESELEQIGAGGESANRSVVEKIGLRGREFLLRNRKAIKDNQLPRLLTDAGRTLSDSDFIEKMDDDELNQASEPLRAVRRRQSEIESSVETLRTESGELVDRFNNVAGGRKLSSARKQRESEIEDARVRLNEVLVALGTIAHEANIPELSEEIEQLSEATSRAAHFRSMIARLEAGKEMIRVQKEIDARIARREKAVGQIRELEAHIAELEREQKELSAELAQYRKERGDEEQLFES
jgi:hypothetical protein